MALGRQNWDLNVSLSEPVIHALICDCLLPPGTSRGMPVMKPSHAFKVTDDPSTLLPSTLCRSLLESKLVSLPTPESLLICPYSHSLPDMVRLYPSGL